VEVLLFPAAQRLIALGPKPAVPVFLMSGDPEEARQACNDAIRGFVRQLEAAGVEP
jgi:hypothetical protein